MPEAEGVLLHLYIKPGLEGRKCFQIEGKIWLALIQFPHQAGERPPTRKIRPSVSVCCVVTQAKGSFNEYDPDF